MSTVPPSFWSRLSIGLFILGILFASTAQAAEASKFPPFAWDQGMVNQIASAAREGSLPKAKLSDGSLVGPESAEEKTKSLLPETFTKKVVDHAVFWNTVDWCGLSLEKADFTEFMDAKKWNGKQLAFIAVLHGTTTGLVREQLQGLGKCPIGFKDFILKNYPQTANL